MYKFYNVSGKLNQAYKFTALKEQESIQKTKDKRQKTKDRRQKTEDRRQKTEDRRQKTEDRRQKTEDRRQKAEDRRQKTEDRRQKTEDRRQKTKDKGFNNQVCLSCLFRPLCKGTDRVIIGVTYILGFRDAILEIGQRLSFATSHACTIAIRTSRV